MKKFEDLKGKIIVEIEGDIGDDELIFTLNDGIRCRLYHEQDCCEFVLVEDICGDFELLYANPLLTAEEVTSQDNPEDASKEALEYQESYTWTFYKLSTIKGTVTIRWYGGSNGYYSEEVDFEVCV